MLNPLKIKKRIIEIGHKTQAGHVASALSCAEVLCKIYNDKPEAIVILSKGHGALAQYVILNELGRLPSEVLATYQQDGGLSEHATLAPEYGLYASTGSLGHGLAIGLGYAIAWPDKLVVVVLGDGELEEGSTMEAMRLIVEMRVSNIAPIIDVNGWQGFKEVSGLLPVWTNRAGGMELPYAVFYSTKGEGFGVVEDKLDSHYTKISNDIAKTWKRKKKKQ